MGVHRERGDSMDARSTCSERRPSYGGGFVSPKSVDTFSVEELESHEGSDLGSIAFDLARPPPADRLTSFNSTGAASSTCSETRNGIGFDSGSVSSWSGGDGNVMADYQWHQEVVVRRMKERVISLVLGNLFSLAVIGLFYLNYVLFESYFDVFLYSFLASEGLWDTKTALVKWLAMVNDDESISPRKWIISNWAGSKRLREGSIFTLSFVVLLVAVAAARSLKLVIMSGGALVGGIVITYVLDRHVFFLTRCHRYLLDDHSYVSLMLILILLVCGVVLSTLFAFFTAHDLKSLIQWISKWFETKLLKAEWAQDLWKSVSQHGSESLENWLGTFEKDYVTNTTYAPVFQWATRFVEDSRVAGGHTNGSISFEASLTEGWSQLWTIPEWVQSRSLQETASIVMEHSQEIEFSSLGVEVQDLILQASDSFWASALFALSALFLIVDIGVRVVFFLTITFVLLKSETNLLHEMISGFFTKGEPITPLPSVPTPSNGTNGSTGAAGTSSLQTNGREDETGPTVQTRRKLSKGSEIEDNLSDYHSVPEDELESSSPSPSQEQEDVTDVSIMVMELRNIIEGVLTLPIKLSIYHAVVTIFLFKAFQLDFVFLAATMSILLTIFPLFYSHWVCVPWCIACAYNGELLAYGQALVLFAVHYYLYTVVDTWALKKLLTRRYNGDIPVNADDQSKNEFITGVSVFFGLTAFGAYGVLIGPLLVSLGLFAYKILRDQQRSVKGITRSSENNRAALNRTNLMRVRSYTRPIRTTSEDINFNRENDLTSASPETPCFPKTVDGNREDTAAKAASAFRISQQKPLKALPPRRRPQQKARRPSRPTPVLERQSTLTNSLSNNLFGYVVNAAGASLPPSSPNPRSLKRRYHETDARRSSSNSLSSREDREERLNELKDYLAKGIIQEEDYRHAVCSILADMAP